MAIRFLIFSGIIYLFYILSENFLSLDYFNITKIKNVTTLIDKPN